MSQHPQPYSALRRGLEALAAHEEEFRRLDAAAGDGDLGITVRSTCEAALEWLRAHPDAEASVMLAGLAEVCANTNPATFSSLVARGLVAAAKSIGPGGDVGLAPAVTALDAGIAMVARRGGAAAGEKTFLDALLPALTAMRAADSFAEALPLMVRAAVQGTQQTMPELARHGRAAWVGERARGVPDAGCVVVIRFLEALAGPDTVPWTADATEDHEDQGGS